MTQDTQAEVITEHSWQYLRLIVAHDPVAAPEQTGRRNARIDALIDQANAWPTSSTSRISARPVATARSRTAGRRHGSITRWPRRRIMKLDLKSPVLRDHIDWKTRALAELMDGRLLLVTNATNLTAPEVVDRYKALADNERGFRVLKCEMEIGPLYHRLLKWSAFAHTRRSASWH